MQKRWIRWAGTALMLLWAHGQLTLPAQSTQGAILGTIKDPSGAVIGSAQVTVTDTDSSTVRQLTSDKAGSYQALNLEPGHYTLQTTREGFQPEVEQSLILTARQQLRIDVTLQPGGGTQQVTVNASDAGVIQTDTPSIAAALDPQEVLNLPANYRGAGSTSPLSVIQTLPGVQPDSGSFPPTPSANGTPAFNFSIQGGLPSQSETTVDGISAQNVTDNSAFSDAFPSAESIAEIRVDGVSNNAEYGQPGEITTVTKSGTNALHGSLFWYFQNSGFDATPYGARSKPKKVANDFGASLGGPVVIPHLYHGRDKTFFFGTYEGFRFPQAVPVQYLVPTDLMKAGNFSQEVAAGGAPLTNPFTGTPYPNNTLPGVNPSAAAFLNLFPSPNIGNTTSVLAATHGLGYNYAANRANNYTSNQFDARIDQYFGQRALLYGRFTWKNIGLLSPTVLNIPENTDFDRYRILVTSFSYNFTPQLVNEFRFGFTREANGTANPLNGASLTNAAGFHGIGPNYPSNGTPVFYFNTLQSLNAGRLNNDYQSNLYQYNDILSWQKGGHTMKYGLDIRSTQAITPLSNGGGDNYGTFYFNGGFTGQEYADYLLGLPSQTFTTNIQSDNNGRANMYAFFAQDSWKVTPNFTADFGLRYEYHPAYHEDNGEIGNFDPSVPLSGRVLYPAGAVATLAPGELANFNACPTPGVANPYATGQPVNGAPCTPVVSSAQAGLPSGLKSVSRLRFLPRIGFAWRPFGNDKTAVRAGFGVYEITQLGSSFYSLTGALQSNLQNFNNVETPTGPSYQWPNLSPNGASLNAPVYGTASFFAANQVHWQDPYSLQWNLSVDRELPGGVGARVSYIAMKSDHLVWQPNLNDMSYSSTTPAVGYTDPVTGQAVAGRPLTDRPFPNWASLYTRATGATANYQSGQVEVSRRFRGGLQFDSAYTFARNLADNQGPQISSFASELGGTGSGASYLYDRSIDFGNVYGTRRHRWITSGIYDLPVGRGRAFGSDMNRVLDAAVGGWQLSNIFLLQSGPFLTPYIPFNAADPSGTGSGPLYFHSQHPDRIGSGVPRQQNRNQWVDPTAFACPSNTGYTAASFAGNPCSVGVTSTPIGRFGTSRDGEVAGPGTVNLSTGLSKVFSVTERVKLRAQGTFTNVLNHTNLADPILDVTNPSFGKITAARGSDFGGNRTGQVAVRVEF